MKKAPNEVNAYIASAPEEAQSKLKELRAAILEVAPDATERTDYFQMPGYSLEGHNYYNSMFVWFSFKKPYVRLHVYPEVIQNHKNELIGYPTTKAIVSFPLDKEIPKVLVNKLVRESINAMKVKP
jgi:uncharacterized protein YdhG (YjbR/CyaY superfamily)